MMSGKTFGCLERDRLEKYVYIFRIIGSGTLVILLVLAIVGMEWITRVNNSYSLVVMITVVITRCKSSFWCCSSAAR